MDKQMCTCTMEHIDVSQKCNIERQMLVTQYAQCDTIYINLKIHETIVSWSIWAVITEYHRLGVLTTNIYFSQKEPGSLRSEDQHGQVLSRGPLFDLWTATFLLYPHIVERE